MAIVFTPVGEERLLRAGEFFRRGTGPLVSVLIPTREGPEKLVRALDSLVQTAWKKEDLEFLLKVDEDDKKTLDALPAIKDRFKARVLVTPRGNGYVDFHLWINQLAEMAAGDWFLVFNDNMIMKTWGWDLEVLAAFPPCPWVGMNEVCTIFPTKLNDIFLIRKNLYHILGHVSRSAFCDSWVYEITDFLGVVLRYVWDVEHANQEPDDRRKMLHSRAMCFHSSNESRKLKIEDTLKIFAYMERVSVWTQEPRCPGWYMGRHDGLVTTALMQGGKDNFFVGGDPPMFYRFKEPLQPFQWCLLNGF